MNDEVRARVVVTGRVQGVSFRAHTEREARRRGLRGWVRNRPDRTVEAVFEGPRVAVEAVVAWCRRGPTAAAVTELAVDYGPVQGEPPFAVRYG
jgi:acylphosphatase